MSKRTAIPKPLRQKVLNFYSGVCVATGESGPGIDLHHLDENNANHTFANLIPLASTLNNAIDRYGSTKAVADHRLRGEALDLISRTKYNDGLYSLAYGCSRLASFLCAVSYGQADRAMLSACRALLALRVINQLELAEDTLRRTVLSLLNHDVGKSSSAIRPDTKAMLALEIGSYFRDVGLLRKAGEWLDLSERFLSDPLIVANDVTRQELESRVFQHRMILKGGQGDRSAELDWIRKLDSGEGRYAHEFGSTNVMLWRGHALRREGKLDEALDLMREAEQKYGPIFVEPVAGSTGQVPKAYNHWTYAQLKFLYADLCKERGGRLYAEMSEILMRDTAVTFSVYSIVPTLIYPLPRSDLVTARRTSDQFRTMQRTCNEIWDKLK